MHKPAAAFHASRLPAGAAGALLACTLSASALLCAGAHAQAPEYKFDAEWPQLPLPNKWWMQGVTGLYVDHEDIIWVLNRPSNLNNTEDYAQLDPPTGECCVAPPAVIAFDTEGNVVEYWDTQEGHGMTVDTEGHVWVGQDTVRKYTRDGTLVAEVASVDRDTNPPPDTPAVVGGLEEVRVDEAAREVFYVDNYLNGRVMVHDMDTLEFKRGWGAYGKPLAEISMDAPDLEYEIGAPPAQEWLGHVTLGLSNDGLVYVADRQGNRIQVFTTAGEYIEEFFLATTTLQRGSAGGVSFSHDAEQQYLIIPDIQNNTVWILNREDGEIVTRVGSAGDNGGQFHGMHMVSVDSSGNLYTGEVQQGERVQRFRLMN
ncbi:MAG: hypothetical protein OXQ89_20275 [Rhodospirillaceae bacterium]|nr:hypothetical protein [Rhodospirillaceae bacterium]